MLLIQNKATQLSQPQGAAQVDRSTPLGARIVYASRVFDGCFDIVRNKLPVAVSTNRPTISVSGNGRAGEFVPASSQYYSITTATNLVPSYPLTVACWARLSDYYNGGVIYSLNGSGYSAILGFNAGYYMVNQGSTSGVAVNSAVDAGNWVHVVCVHRSGTFALYINGVLRSQTPIGNYWGQPASGNHSIGNRLNGSTPQYFNGAIKDLYVFKGELSATEAKSLYQNHWQIFKPLPQNIFLPVPTGGTTTYTLTAQPGSYSLTGISATLLKSKLITAQTGSYTYTGNNATLTFVPNTAVYTLTAQAGTYSYSGTSASISRHRNLTASSGAYSISGSSATISRNRRLTATAGTYNINGQQVTITRTTLTPVYTLTALPGSYSLSGSVATILKHRSLTAQTGAYTYMGNTVTINKYTPGATTLIKYLNVLTGELLILKQLS